MKKIDRDLILLPNDRYGVVASIYIYFEFLLGCPDREFQIKVEPKLTLGNNREIGKDREISKNSEKLIATGFYH